MPYCPLGRVNVWSLAIFRLCAFTRQKVPPMNTDVLEQACSICEHCTCEALPHTFWKKKKKKKKSKKHWSCFLFLVLTGRG
uniref:Putative secreted protein n=1 Tax=Ixodes scapularis TaxID=6945 RepID=A0A4D5S0B5_IXOSC